MLAGEKFRSLLQELRGHFDLLILDTPPILPVPDALTISEQLDAFILVFRLSHTPYKLLRQAVDELGTGKIMGVVLNGDEKKSDKYYSRYYGNYYKPTDIEEKNR
jgi:Mrp family chromosome partitioning ATPase